MHAPREQDRSKGLAQFCAGTPLALDLRRPLVNPAPAASPTHPDKLRPSHTRERAEPFCSLPLSSGCRHAAAPTVRPLYGRRVGPIAISPPLALQGG